MKTVQVTDVRKRISEILDEVSSTLEPVEILRHGKPVAALVPASEASRSSRKPVVDLDLLGTFCRKHEVRRFFLFGSVLRSDFGPDSDVDVLVDLGNKKLGFHEECRMADELEAMFGRDVDMLTPDCLARANPRRRASIESEMVKVYDHVS